MIKLTWGNLRAQDFVNSFAKLAKKPMGYDIGSRLALIGNELQRQQKLLEETHEGLLKKFGSVDEKRPGFYNLKPETRAEYDEEIKKLDAHEFKVRIKKFDAKQLCDSAQLTAEDMILLENILLPIENPDEADIKASEPKQDNQPTAH